VRIAKANPAQPDCKKQVAQFQVTDRYMGTKKKIGFAVVGLGSIAKSSVLPAFAHCKNAKLVALIGRDEKIAARLATQFRVSNVYSAEQYSDCLANPLVEAVYIATPPGTHLGLAVAAARAGKHVLCEKPLAATVAQAAEIVEVCRTNGVLLMTAYRKHFEPSTLFIRKLLRDGALGRIDMVHAVFSELHVPGRSVDWLLDHNLAGGGPLMDLGIYCVNTTRWLLGEDPTQVTAAKAWTNDSARFREVEEGVSFSLKFPGGTILQGATTYSAAISSFLFIQGTKGWLSLTPAFPFDEPRLLTGKIAKRSIEKKFKLVDEFAPEIGAFADAIIRKKPIQPDGVQGLRDMEILHAIYEAARKNESIAMRY
jgi:predicted dehydrogenase